MKAITLYQPWATLVINGAKRYETRSWSTPHRGLLLIHAGKRWTPELAALCLTPPYRAALTDIGFDLTIGLGYRAWDIPLGAILGTVELRDCIPTFRDLGLSAAERAFGDFGPRRWAWELANPRPFDQPIPYRGSLGIFDVPEAALITRPSPAI